MLSDVEIWNLAVDQLGERTIASFSGTDPMSVKARRIYPQCRDLLLRSHPWVFAMWKSEWPSLTPQMNPTMQFPTVNEGESIYLLPSDSLRIVRVGGEEHGKGIKYQVLDRFLIAPYTGPIPVRYVRRVTNPNKFTPDFIELLTLLIVMRVSDDLKEIHRSHGEFIKRFSESQLVDIGENLSNPPNAYVETESDILEGDSWLGVRV